MIRLAISAPAAKNRLLWAARIAAAATLLLPSPSLAATRTWDAGGSDNNWSTGQNWSGDTAPGPGDVALFDGSGNGKTDSTVDASFPGRIFDLTLGSSFTGAVTLGRGLSMSGSVTLSGGTLDVSSSNYALVVGGQWVGRGGAFVAHSGTVTFTGTGAANTLSGSSVFNNLTIDNGLVGYWKLDEGIGTIAKDSSRYGNNGTLTSGPVWTGSTLNSTASLKFFDPNALKFDGTDDHVLFNTLSLSTVNSFSFWIDNRDTGSAIIFGNTDAGGYGAFFDGNGAGNTLYYSTGGSNFVGVVHGGLTSGTWYHIAVVRNGTSVTFYKNGSQIGATQLLASDTELTVRALASYSDEFTRTLNGSLDDVRIYNRALSLSEVKALYNGNPHTGSGVYSLGSKLSITGSLMNYTGELRTGNAYPITVTGSWLNHGQFTSTGTVYLRGKGAQTMTGSTVFANLNVQTPNARTLFLDHSARQSVSGSLVLQGGGSASTRLSLRSTRTGSASNLLLDGDAGNQIIDWLDVKDNDASGGKTLLCTRAEGCADSGNTTNWLFEYLRNLRNYFFLIES